MPKNLLILKFLYGRDRPSGFLASKEQGVEEVALQIADMLIIKLRSLKTDTDQRAAMNKAIEYVRHQGLLQPIKRSE